MAPLIDALRRVTRTKLLIKLPDIRAIVRYRPSSSNISRIGHLPFWFLVASTIGTVAFIGYISFIWFAANDNSTWRNIALANWTTRSIAVAAVVLRNSSTVQASIACSMLAGILLEGPGIHMPKLAEVSIMRAAPPALHTLFRHVWHLACTRNWLLPILAALLTVTTIFLQFTSTILLSDFSTGYVTGFYSCPVLAYIPRSSASDSRQSKWSLGVRQYSAFAEYSDGRAVNGSSGLSDTGKTMRALLPICSEEHRSLIHKFEGYSVVFDTRVICVRPHITNLGIQNTAIFPTIYGNISIPSDMQEATAASGVYGSFLGNFACPIPATIGPARYHLLDWNMTVCEIMHASSHLPSLFKTDHIQRTYLILNFTRARTTADAVDALKQHTYLLKLFNGSEPGLTYKKNTEWVEIYRKNGSHTTEESETRLSLSVCFASFEAEHFNISASSAVPLTEPRYTLDLPGGGWEFDEVRKQMLTSPDRSLENRGVLSLKPQNWTNTVNDEIQYYYFDRLTLQRLLSMEESEDSLLLQEDSPIPGDQTDVSIGGLFLNILRTGGTNAEAVQSMLMGVIESQYNSYMFPKGLCIKGIHVEAEQNQIPIRRADFVAVQIPGGRGRPANQAAGATIPYILVISVVFVHNASVFGIVMWFFKATTTTLIWESWSNIGQIISPETEFYLSKVSGMRDSEVKAWMKNEDLHLVNIKIAKSVKYQDLFQGETELRSQGKDHPRQTESEEAIMMDHFCPNNPLIIEATEHGSETPEVSSIPSIDRGDS